MSRTHVEISLGIIMILVTSTIILFYGLNEEQRMSRFVESQNAQAVEVGAELFDTYCSRCHGPQGLGIQGLCPPLNDRAFFDNRLSDVGWSGTIEDYIIATASGGRLASTRPQLYPGAGSPAMPAFSERYGGPLRDDQIRNIAAYIINWEETAQLVQAAEAPTGPVVGDDLNQTLPEGDAAAGEALATSAGCTACHILAPTGPAWLPSDSEPGIGERAAARIEDPGYTGAATSPEQYLFESIIHPEAYLVPNFADLMPKNYGETLTPQNVADLIAYLQTLK